MGTKREVEGQFKRIEREMGEEKIEIDVPRELLEKMERVRYLLGVEIEDLVRCAVRRFLDRFENLDKPK